MEKAKVNYKTILAQKEYMKVIIAAIINRFGDSVDAVAYTWLVYELTGNAGWSALIFGLNKLPSVFITPFAGAWVESHRKKQIMIGTDLIRAVCVASIATTYLLGVLQPWILVVTTLVISTVEAFRGPASTAFTPQVLKKEYYEYGMSLSSSLTTVVEIIGTAAAAGIIAIIGTSGAIYVDMTTFILSALVIACVKAEEEKLEASELDLAGYRNNFIEGIHYVGKNNKLVFFVGACIFLNAILVPFNSLQAPLAQEILGGGAEVLSILAIAVMAGMLLGSMTYPVIREHVAGKVLFILGGMGIGAYYILLVLGKPFYDSLWKVYVLSAVASVLFGYFITLLMSYVQVEFVKQTDERFLARAAAIMTAFSSAATPVTSFIVSAFVLRISTEHIFLVAGLLDVVGCGLLIFSKTLAEEESLITKVEVE